MIEKPELPKLMGGYFWRIGSWYNSFLGWEIKVSLRKKWLIGSYSVQSETQFVETNKTWPYYKACIEGLARVALSQRNKALQNRHKDAKFVELMSSVTGDYGRKND